MQIPGLGDDQILGDSMLDEIRRTAERRLHQIKPLLEEAERLRDVLEVLERQGASARAAMPASSLDRHQQNGPLRPGRSNQRSRGSAARAGSDDRSSGGVRAAKGSNKRAILQLVTEQPGITPSEISQLTGMKRTVVASTVSRLKRYGELLDHESGGVCVPAASTDHSEASTPARAVVEHRGELSARSARTRRLASLQQQRAA